MDSRTRDRIAEYRDLRSIGETNMDSIAARMGMTRKTLQRMLQRHVGPVASWPGTGDEWGVEEQGTDAP